MEFHEMVQRVQVYEIELIMRVNYFVKPMRVHMALLFNLFTIVISAPRKRRTRAQAS